MGTYLSALLTLCLSISLIAYSHAQAGSPFQDRSNTQEGAKPETAEKNAVEKGEVGRMLDQLKERNEFVIGRCLENSPCKPLKITGADKHVIEGGVVEGKSVSRPQPSYPPIAKAAHITGSVTVEMIIDEEGKVIAAQAISGHPLLQAAALKAARETRFDPTLLDGKPVKVLGAFTYNFMLK